MLDRKAVYYKIETYTFCTFAVVRWFFSVGGGPTWNGSLIEVQAIYMHKYELEIHHEQFKSSKLLWDANHKDIGTESSVEYMAE